MLDRAIADLTFRLRELQRQARYIATRPARIDKIVQDRRMDAAYDGFAAGYWNGQRDAGVVPKMARMSKAQEGAWDVTHSRKCGRQS